MATMACPQCNRLVDDSQKVCPGCRFNIRKYAKEMKKKGAKTGGALSLGSVYDHSSTASVGEPELEFLRAAEPTPAPAPSVTPGNYVQPAGSDPAPAPAYQVEPAATPAAPSAPVYEAPAAAYQATPAAPSAPVYEAPAAAYQAAPAASSAPVYEAPAAYQATPAAPSASVYEAPASPAPVYQPTAAGGAESEVALGAVFDTTALPTIPSAPSAPASGYQAVAPSAPAAGYQATAPSAPGSGYQAVAPSAPGSGYQASAPSASVSGYQATASSVPASGYQASAPSAPAAGYQATAPQQPVFESASLNRAQDMRQSAPVYQPSAGQQPGANNGGQPNPSATPWSASSANATPTTTQVPQISAEQLASIPRSNVGEPIFESASLNYGGGSGGALSGARSGPTIMEKLRMEREAKEAEASIFESQSLRQEEKALEAGTMKPLGGLSGQPATRMFGSQGGAEDRSMVGRSKIGRSTYSAMPEGQSAMGTGRQKAPGEVFAAAAAVNPWQSPRTHLQPGGYGQPAQQTPGAYPGQSAYGQPVQSYQAPPGQTYQPSAATSAPPAYHAQPQTPQYQPQQPGNPFLGGGSTPAGGGNPLLGGGSSGTTAPGGMSPFLGGGSQQ